MNKQSYLLPVYTRIGPVFVRGEGSFLWDDKGNKYLDLFPGWGVGILGHSHPRICKVVSQQAKELIFLPNNLNHPWQSLLAKEIVNNSFKGKVFFANSGAEAIEAALKLTRLYGRGKRFEVITMGNSFHGRTFGALSATGQKKYKQPFKPILPGFKEARFRDLADFKKKVTKKTVAVLLELIQGEGGVNVADKHYVKELRKFCKAHDLLFIVDEVQTGMGRTAELFCYQHYPVVPDIMVLSKGLGAGIPVSCMVAADRIAGVMKPGHHASTFGGNPLAARVSLEVFRIIKEEKILYNVRKMSGYLTGRLEKFKARYRFIKEVRGLGLMMALELKIKSYPIFEQAFKKRLIINSTHENVLRIMPALGVKRAELDQGMNILEEIFERLK